MTDAHLLNDKATAPLLRRRRNALPSSHGLCGADIAARHLDGPCLRKGGFMPFQVNHAALGTKSRVALVHMLNLNLRQLEEWRRAQTGLFGAPLDIESTMILMAIVAIGMENLVRSGKLKDFENLSSPLDFELLRKSSLSSIAETTGLNREMVRRKVGKLERRGILERLNDGGIRMPEGILARGEVRQAVEHQLVSMVATFDRLVRDGVLDEV